METIREEQGMIETIIRDAAKRRAIVYFSGDEWELIDAARGNVTRAAFLKAAGLDAAKRKGRVT